MNYYEVTDNIPVPPDRKSVLTKAIRSLEIGQSLLVPFTDQVAARNVFTKLRGIKTFTTRTEKGKGLRVWRVS